MAPSRFAPALALAFSLGLLAPGCASAPTSAGDQAASSYTTLVSGFHNTRVGAPLSLTSSMELDYAKGYTVDFLEGDHALICTADGKRYLTKARGTATPTGLDEDIRVIEVPLNTVYLAASDTMCLFDALGCVDRIAVSGLKRDRWSIQAARDAFDRGSLVFGGSYRSPDYELLLDKGVTLAIESTMINHTPEVSDKLEELGIPVFVELSSYEEDPLARAEWIKLWGVLLDRESQADEVFSQQVALLEAAPTTSTGKTVAFFYLNSQGSAVVRRPGDYVCRLIELAGGTYAYQELEAATRGSSTVTLEMERFWALTKDADVIIYNGSIDDTVSGIDDLIDRCPALADSRAVHEGAVWATEQNMYQDMIHAGQVARELRCALEDEKTPLTYLRRLT